MDIQGVRYSVCQNTGWRTVKKYKVNEEGSIRGLQGVQR